MKPDRKNFTNNQQKAWESEYRNPRFLTLGSKATAEVMRFAKWLKKKYRAEWSKNRELSPNNESRKSLGDLTVLDLGCGTGRNSLYFAEYGAKIIGYDISPTAIKIANERARDLGLDDSSVKFSVHDIGTPYNIESKTIDVILDTTSSHALTQAGRVTYLKECARVLKDDGVMLVRLLTKDGDKNAKFLLKEYPGPEENSYILPGIGVIERVASFDDISLEYGNDFKIESSERTSHYATFGDKKFKRSYRVLYLSIKPRLKSA